METFILKRDYYQTRGYVIPYIYKTDLFNAIEFRASLRGITVNQSMQSLMHCTITICFAFFIRPNEMTKSPLFSPISKSLLIFFPAKLIAHLKRLFHHLSTHIPRKKKRFISIKPGTPVSSATFPYTTKHITPNFHTDSYTRPKKTRAFTFHARARLFIYSLFPRAPGPVCVYIYKDGSASRPRA